jgi:hypothetical protein
MGISIPRLSLAIVVAGFAVALGRELVACESAGQSQAVPKVSTEFQAEVSQLASNGLRLKEALEANLEGSGRHLAAIFQREKPKAPKEAFEFRIIENDAQGTRTIFKRTDFFFSFLLAGQPNRLNATDINGDGLKEIVVQSSSGGNCWSCNPTEIYQVRNHKGGLLAAAPIQRLADLNNDGILELLITDARWESYDDLSHAASPGAVMVYAWRNGRYVYSARDFGDFYKSEVDKLKGSIDDAKSQINAADEYSDEVYIGLALGLAITYTHMGEPEQGLKEMEALLLANSKSAAQTKHRAIIMEDFKKGESAKKLREMKNGDPLSL